MRRAAALLHRVDLQRTARVIAMASAELGAAGAVTAAPPGFVRLGPLASVAQGLSEVQLPAGGAKLVIVRRGAGAADAAGADAAAGLHALGGECPHSKGQMSVGDIEEAAGTAAAAGAAAASGACIICPRQRKRFEGGLRFNLETGRSFLLGGPGGCNEYKPEWRLPVHEVRVIDGEVFVSEAPRPETAAAGGGGGGGGPANEGLERRGCATL